MTKLMDAPQQVAAAKPGHAWLRALELTAASARTPHRLLFDVIEELASRCGDAAALLSDRECFDFRGLYKRASLYCCWALEQGIGRGEVVGLLMTNRPEYFALWVGITAAGGIVALLNTNLVGASLAHCINVVRPKHIIVEDEFAESFGTALPEVSGETEIWIHGADVAPFRRIDTCLESLAPISDSMERPRLSFEDLALYIYTSGTSGLPKAARLSHGRILQWAYWFAGMLDIRGEDRMYDCLPMYHSIGGVLAPAATLVSGGSVVVRDRFSAGRFWNDVVQWDCTMFQYIGEFCRYLYHTAPSQDERAHRIRVACGNGLSPDVWRPFQERFQIPKIFEFYASTEGGLSLFNAEGEVGSIGRVPPYLAHRVAPAIVKFDPEKGEPIRNEEGFCIKCLPDEPGEALAPMLQDPSQAGTRFEGYSDSQATDGKLLRDVFKTGDVWVRTGDLMRRDGRGFYYFVDRVGETFRWKGENVATTEVANVISSFPGVQHAIVYGVRVAGAEGRVGMAAISPEGELNLSALREHLVRRLPTYARPAFIRIANDFAITGTFKYSKSDLVKQSYDPEGTSDAIYFDNPQTQTLQPLDRNWYARIHAGEIRF
ncbi:long-chain-acyl-CoA synthetase [Occallatibacter riparius]|uniref:Long-chain-acyl-CoA synthetase n=1 Tax=Occallatibacter riparius TaxID=1002689 RepID=A0A9J7BLE9_9BACT|nr:long-chain-acyl-CoA synthetase [Occallatibacter riparius]UWZ83708.1 long-chain-acyl-CoA synthetase [Occallatibacter riparius]